MLLEMAETKVGIRAFLNDQPEIIGTFKHRMTDFLVEEVGLDGRLRTHNPQYKQGSLTRTRKCLGQQPPGGFQGGLSGIRLGGVHGRD